MWLPGKCAYCDGSGKVDAKMEDKVPVDTAYLVDGLSEDERHRIIIGEPEALEQGRIRVGQIQHFIDQVSYLHLETSLNAKQITEFFLIGEKGDDSNQNQRQELLDYIQLIIGHQSSRH